MSLSILIPTYNGVCLSLVTELQRQAEELKKIKGGEFCYEIIVADDGSTDTDAINANMGINDLPCCRYIVRGFNAGRAAIRNFLARTAQYDSLVFMDGDMEAQNTHYVENYERLSGSDVVYGGYNVRATAEELRRNLNCAYEHRFALSNTMPRRTQDANSHFRTHNFMVRRSVMLRLPFDERFRRYGYEDILWSKTLRDNGISVTHADNPLTIADFDDNATFMAKTEEGLRTLLDFAPELEGYSSLLAAVRRLSRLHLLGAVRMWHAVFGRCIKNNLSGNKPQIFLFNIYKLGSFCSAMAEQKN